MAGLTADERDTYTDPLPRAATDTTPGATQPGGTTTPAPGTSVVPTVSPSPVIADPAWLTFLRRQVTIAGITLPMWAIVAGVSAVGYLMWKDRD